MDQIAQDQSSEALRKRFVQGGFDLSGVVDLHVHSAPCIFPRLGDDIQIATRGRDAGLRALAFKSHHESTVGRAYLTQLVVPGIRVLGGVTLNWPVGGINPAAVETAFMTGGRIVWGPSGHSVYHGSITGEVGNWGIPGMNLPSRRTGGVTVLDETGRLTPEAVDVLDLVAQYDGLFATSHLSLEEILRILEYAQGHDVRVLVNHIFYFPRCDAEFIEKIANLGGYIEFITALVLPNFSNPDINYSFDRIASTMKQVGYDRCIVSSDAGGVFMGLWPHEQLRLFGQGLLGAGVHEDHIRTMMSKTPAELARLDDEPDIGRPVEARLNTQQGA